MKKLVLSPGDIKRFWSKVDIHETDECWEWQACKDNHGYGQFKLSGNGKGPAKAHRIAWAIHNNSDHCGSIVVHNCKNRACMNPSHLRSVLKGESYSMNRKLTKADVHSIRKEIAEGKTQVNIAAGFHVKRSTISGISTGRTWKWLVEE